MASDELSRIRERMRQHDSARAQAFTESRASGPTAETRIGCTFAPGDRVFDRVTGQNGMVLGGTRENVIVSTARR